ncbi:MAG: hypothetical protein ABFE02_11155 [Sulfuricella sp.]
MSLIVGHEANQRKAFDNIVTALDFDRLLPARVFLEVWSDFLFFQSDYIFAPEFVEVMGESLRLENAHVSCLLNLDKTGTFEFGDIAAIFLDERVTGREYRDELHGRGSADGWLYLVDRYARASDVGEWCIYCEKANDVAVIGFRGIGGVEKFEKPLKRLWARPIEELVDGGHTPVFPFNNLTPTWRKGLVQHYGAHLSWGNKGQQRVSVRLKNNAPISAQQ